MFTNILTLFFVCCFSCASVFPARAPSNATLAALLGVAPGSDRTAEQQAGIQLAALFITLIISIFGGMFTGLIIKMPIFLPGLKSEKANWCECGKSTHPDYWYEDDHYWNVEEENSEEEHESERLLGEEMMRRNIDAQISQLTSQRAKLNGENDVEAPAATSANPTSVELTPILVAGQKEK